MTTASSRRTRSSSPPRCSIARRATPLILIRIESKAGHGAGKPTSKRIDEEADTYAFLFQNIGVPYKPVAK